MTTRAEFYRQRDRRTTELGPDTDQLAQPVGVIVDPGAARSPAGQSMVLAMINQCARAHRSIRLDIPSVPMTVEPLAGGSTLDEAVRALALAIDPFIVLEPVRDPEKFITLCLGCKARPGITRHVGVSGSIAHLARQPVPSPDGPVTLASCMAATLGSYGLFREAIGEPAADWQIDVGATFGLPGGTGSNDSIDVGRVCVVGAGGVGSCFAYWAREFGVVGEWTVVDGDRVSLSNTNRCMAFMAADAGWPESSGRYKAEVAANLLGATWHSKYYHQIDPAEIDCDVILPLANEHDVRRVIAHRCEPVLLHATTSIGWEAQLHRHVPGVDDCIVCRLPEGTDTVSFGCGSGVIGGSGGRTTDAALPFMSATAGLLLVAGLFALQNGAIQRQETNLWAICFRDRRRVIRTSKYACRVGCVDVQPSHVRRRAHWGRRWSLLDREANPPQRSSLSASGPTE